MRCFLEELAVSATVFREPFPVLGVAVADNWYVGKVTGS